MSGWGDEESPFLDFLWHLWSALHIFSGKLCISLGNLVMSLLTQWKFHFHQENLARKKKELGFSIGHPFYNNIFWEYLSLVSSLDILVHMQHLGVDKTEMVLFIRISFNFGDRCCTNLSFQPFPNHCGKPETGQWILIFWSFITTFKSINIQWFFCKVTEFGLFPQTMTQ